MTTLTVSKARINLYKLLDEAAASHNPIQITGKTSECNFNLGRRLAVNPENTLSSINSKNAGINPKGA